MTRLGRFVILPVISLLALALVAITVAQSDSGPVAEVRVWQKLDDPLNIHVSARATDGSWKTLGTVRLKLDGVSPGGRYRYGDFTVPAPERVEEEEVLTLLYWQAPTLPGPYLSAGFKDQDAGAVTLEPLAHHAPDGELAPALAEAIPTVDNGGVSADGLTITWKLREGLKWSDGSDMTASDVVFTWEYCSDEATGCTAEDAFTGIASVEALDDRTVRITYEAPTPYPYDAFVGASTPIISRAQFADCVGEAASGCEEENTHPLGTGPYRIVSFTADEEAVYERNPHYRGERPYFDRVVLKGGGDAVAAGRAVLVAGEADYAWNLQIEADVLAELEAGGEGTIVLAFSDLVERIVLNQTNPDPGLGDARSEYLDGENPHPFLTFRPIRQAMSMAIDREQVAALYEFAGKPECDLVAGPPEYVSGANDSCLTQDTAGANALLDEHGVLDTDGDGIREHNGSPLRITFMTTTNSLRQATQELVRDWWREIGIETELIDHSAGAYFGNTPGPESYRRFFADVQMYATGGGIEPQNYLSDNRCTHIPTRGNHWAEGNVARACNPEYDAAYEQLPGLPLGPERETVAKQLNDILVQSYFEIPLVSRGIVSAHINTLKGVRYNAWDSELWNIGEWHR